MDINTLELLCKDYANWYFRQNSFKGKDAFKAWIKHAKISKILAEVELDFRTAKLVNTKDGIELIKQAVANISGKPIKAILGKGRKGEIILYKHIYFWFTKRTFPGLSLNDIGFNVYHHTTVMSGIRVINDRIFTKYEETLSIINDLMAEYDSLLNAYIASRNAEFATGQGMESNETE